MKQDEIVAIKQEAEKQFLGLPGVTGVGVGYKQVGGKKTDEVAIIVYVRAKKPLDKVPEKQRVPAVVNGVKTDVVERTFELKDRLMRVEDLRPKADVGSYDPLRGGISIGPCRSVFIGGADVACQGVPAAGNYLFVGTLGCFVRDNGTGNEMMLSNFHVMALNNNWAAGDTIAQPSRVDGGNCPADVVGTLQRASLGGQVDCAVANHTSRGFACEIADIGEVAGQATATLGMAVRKRGRTTGLTFGTVDDINLTVTIDYCNGLGNVTLTNQIGIDVDTSQSTQFGDGGDSGSVVVDASRNVVGLYFAGNGPGTYGVANPIQAVLTALNVSLCVPATIKFVDDPTIKFADDPTRKFIDDPTIKFADDPTHKFIDDPTIKFADDPTRKFIDDPTLKFADDPTLKFVDDPGTSKVIDDPGTIKFADDGGTSPQLDPYKSPSFDKPPEMDVGKPPAADFGGQPPPGGRPPVGGMPLGAAPFVLATPHHSQAYMGQAAQPMQEAVGQLEARLQQLTQALVQMYQAYEQGSLSPAEQQQLAEGCAEYQALLAQARQLAGAG